MAFAETTDPDFVNPWGSTQFNAGSIRQRAAKVRSRLSTTPKRTYEPAWEDPGRHGSWRDVDLRPREREEVTGQWQRKALRLPRAPQKRTGTGETVLLVGLVVGAGALAWWLWKRRNEPDHVGGEICGFDLLGTEAA